MEKKYLSIGIVALGIVVAFGVLLAQGGKVVGADGFGFEENSEHRKGADAESVAGCMQSCEDMYAGWLEMNPESPNYARQQEKITAKAEQCLAMNELVADSPYSEEEILQSCGLEPTRCVEIPPEIPIEEGACTDISFIEEANLPQCCGFKGPQGGRTCGADQEWVVGVTAYPVCYIPGS